MDINPLSLLEVTMGSDPVENEDDDDCIILDPPIETHIIDDTPDPIATEPEPEIGPGYHFLQQADETLQDPLAMPTVRQKPSNSNNIPFCWVSTNIASLAVVSNAEYEFRKGHYKDVHNVLQDKLHCTICQDHVGCDIRVHSKAIEHPVLKVLTCEKCATHYRNLQFTLNDQGKETRCRWCGKSPMGGGAPLRRCHQCPFSFCQNCLSRNLPNQPKAGGPWLCCVCHMKYLWPARSLLWALQTLKERFLSRPSSSNFGAEGDISFCCKGLGKKKIPPWIINSAPKAAREMAITAPTKVLVNGSPLVKPKFYHLSSLPNNKLVSGGQMKLIKLPNLIPPPPPKLRPISPTVSQPISQSVSRPISQSVSRPISQSVTRPISQSVSRPISQSVSRPISQSVSRPISQSVSQPISQSASQPPRLRLRKIAPKPHRPPTPMPRELPAPEMSPVVVEHSPPASPEPPAPPDCSGDRISTSWLKGKILSYTKDLAKLSSRLATISRDMSSVDTVKNIQSKMDAVSTLLSLNSSLLKDSGINLVNEWKERKARHVIGKLHLPLNEEEMITEDEQVEDETPEVSSPRRTNEGSGTRNEIRQYPVAREALRRIKSEPMQSINKPKNRKKPKRLTPHKKGQSKKKHSQSIKIPPQYSAKLLNELKREHNIRDCFVSIPLLKASYLYEKINQPAIKVERF